MNDENFVIGIDPASPGGDTAVISALSKEALDNVVASHSVGTYGIVGNDKYVLIQDANGDKFWALEQEATEVTPEWMRKWYEDGKKLAINKERTKEELDRLKECVIGAAFIHNYCREKELPSANIDLIIAETAMRWYEADHDNVKIWNPYACKELPAYYDHVISFCTQFSEYFSNVRAAAEAAQHDNVPTFEVEPPTK